MAGRIAALRLQLCKALARSRRGPCRGRSHPSHRHCRAGWHARGRPRRSETPGSAPRRRHGRSRRCPAPAAPARRCPATRSVPTLTQVPELSLKSSATRPSKNRPSSGRAGIGKGHGVADQIKAFGIERLRGQFRRLPVARRDIRAAHAHLELVAGRHQLQFGARDRHADIAGTFGLEMAVGRRAARSRSSPRPTPSAARGRPVLIESSSSASQRFCGSAAPA